MKDDADNLYISLRRGQIQADGAAEILEGELQRAFIPVGSGRVNLCRASHGNAIQGAFHIVLCCRQLLVVDIDRIVCPKRHFGTVDGIALRICPLKICNGGTTGNCPMDNLADVIRHGNLITDFPIEMINITGVDHIYASSGFVNERLDKLIALGGLGRKAKLFLWTAGGKHESCHHGKNENLLHSKSS